MNEASIFDKVDVKKRQDSGRLEKKHSNAFIQERRLRKDNELQRNITAMYSVKIVCGSEKQIRERGRGEKNELGNSIRF